MPGGEKARWVALYAELEKPLYNVVYRVIRDARESQDVVQDAFLRCWRRRESIRPDGLKVVLFRTALNLAINRRRRLKLWRFVGMEAAEEHAAEGLELDATIPRCVHEAVDALPDRYRSVLLLTEVAGMSYSEVSDTLGIGEGTVGSRRSRALAQLREALKSRSETASDSVALKLANGELL